MPASQQRQLQIDMLRIILDTICDCQIAKCWRGWCLDNVYRPMAYLRILSQSDQQKREVARIETEFRMLSNYFLV
ncbi:hypothetical protein [Arenicella xantha]|uniref:Uncharacterized protein n=1 Tax=Arenicella xantha TaxID=644221 RepID=A0A395JIQ4_9GAMM|nr:hypothetical protein [Arenicella xantha]RBP50653.1 hypothetical protein DFR28_10264 [Arenicella xantha]